MKRWMFVGLIVMLAVPAGSAQVGKDGAKQSCTACCKTMMKQHDDMQQMPAMDARLQALVDEMNRAEGAARIDKMAAVINELVAQRTTMKKQMAISGGEPMAGGCPMMKQNEKEPAPSAAHQPH